MTAIWLTAGITILLLALAPACAQSAQGDGAATLISQSGETPPESQAERPGEPALLVMPDVRQKPISEAIRTLESLGLTKWRKVSVASPQEGEIVLRQYPLPGKQVDRKSAWVFLYIPAAGGYEKPATPAPEAQKHSRKTGLPAIILWTLFLCCQVAIIAFIISSIQKRGSQVTITAQSRIRLSPKKAAPREIPVPGFYSWICDVIESRKEHHEQPPERKKEKPAEASVSPAPSQPVLQKAPRHDTPSADPLGFSRRSDSTVPKEEQVLQKLREYYRYYKEATLSEEPAPEPGTPPAAPAPRKETGTSFTALQLKKITLTPEDMAFIEKTTDILLSRFTREMEMLSLTGGQEVPGELPPEEPLAATEAAHKEAPEPLAATEAAHTEAPEPLAATEAAHKEAPEPLAEPEPGPMAEPAQLAAPAPPGVPGSASPSQGALFLKKLREYHRYLTETKPAGPLPGAGEEPPTFSGMSAEFTATQLQSLSSSEEELDFIEKTMDSLLARLCNELGKLSQTLETEGDLIV